MSDMTREALEYVASLGDARIYEANGQKYSDRPLNTLKAPVASALVVNSLNALLDYLKSGFDGHGTVIVHVASPIEVNVYSGLNTNRARENFVTAKALIPQFKFGSYYDVESFNIALQSVFTPTEPRSNVLRIVGNVKEEAVKNVGDDGVSQMVTAKTGVATVADIKVPNPVCLAPYRTFLEIPQPESAFVFRMRSGPECALFEADGGWWKNQAIQGIREYILANIGEHSGRVTILA